MESRTMKNRSGGFLRASSAVGFLSSEEKFPFLSLSYYMVHVFSRILRMEDRESADSAGARPVYLESIGRICYNTINYCRKTGRKMRPKDGDAGAAGRCPCMETGGEWSTYGEGYPSNVYPAAGKDGRDGGEALLFAVLHRPDRRGIDGGKDGFFCTDVGGNRTRKPDRARLVYLWD